MNAFGSAMKDAGLRDADLAKLAGVDRTTVWRWRNGRVTVPSYAWSILRLQRRVRDLSEALTA